MKLTLAVLAAAGLAAAQGLSGLPSCAIPCITEALPKTGCDLVDTACACKKETQEKLMGLVEPCLRQACQPEDIAKTQAASVAACANVQSMPGSMSASGSMTTSGSMSTSSSGSMTSSMPMTMTSSGAMASSSSSSKSADKEATASSAGAGSSTVTRGATSSPSSAAAGSGAVAGGSFAALVAAVMML